jgi:MoxR-like ATPase
MTQEKTTTVKTPKYTTPKGTIKIGRLRKMALRRLGVADRNRAKLDEVLQRGIAALDSSREDSKTTASAVELSGEGSVQKIEGKHKCFGMLLAILKSGLHAYLVGPAGSFKTTAAEQCANELGREFFCQSVGQQTTQSQLLGYMDANGNYVSTVFRKAFEFGGVFLLDEIDAGNANVLTVLNAALANSLCSFPDGMVKRHPDFLCIAAANTIGTGADRQYVGRNQLDAASIDRFAFLDWPYDEELELKIAPNFAWTTYVQKVRRVVAELKVRHVVSPRASIAGGKMLANGVDAKSVAEIVIWKGMDAATRAKVEAGLR